MGLVLLLDRERWLPQTVDSGCQERVKIVQLFNVLNIVILLSDRSRCGYVFPSGAKIT